jgi:hypothetical protein
MSRSHEEGKPRSGQAIYTILLTQNNLPQIQHDVECPILDAIIVFDGQT